MIIFLGILVAICVFFVVVFVHEMGHFLAARWCGVGVDEFGVGIPPRIATIFRDKKGTQWTLNWLPLGGFVRLTWESDLDEPSSSDSLAAAPWWKQVIILLAGVFMNFVLAGLIFAFLFWQGTTPFTLHIRAAEPQSLLSWGMQGTQLFPIYETLADAENAGVIIRQPGVVLDPLADSVAIKSWIETGDILLSIDGIPVNTPQEVTEILHSQTSVVFDIIRDGDSRQVSVVTQDGKMGAYVAPNIVLTEYRLPFWSSLWAGSREVVGQVRLSFQMLGAILWTFFSHSATEEQRSEAQKSVGWPVAIAETFIAFAEAGLTSRGILIMMALISVSLGVFNILPFPALDGGRCLLVIVNSWLHSVNPRFSITQKTEQLIHTVGFMILIGLSILITWKDIFWK